VTPGPRCEEAVARWVEQAPPLSEKQKDTIAAAFNSSLSEGRVSGHE
jgi:hypothetical protein